MRPDSRPYVVFIYAICFCTVVASLIVSCASPPFLKTIKYTESTNTGKVNKIYRFDDRYVIGKYDPMWDRIAIPRPSSVQRSQAQSPVRNWRDGATLVYDFQYSIGNRYPPVRLLTFETENGHLGIILSKKHRMYFESFPFVINGVMPHIVQFEEQDVVNTIANGAQGTFRWNLDRVGVNSYQELFRLMRGGGLSSSSTGMIPGRPKAILETRGLATDLINEASKGLGSNDVLDMLTKQRSQQMDLTDFVESYAKATAAAGALSKVLAGAGSATALAASEIIIPFSAGLFFGLAINEAYTAISGSSLGSDLADVTEGIWNCTGDPCIFDEEAIEEHEGENEPEKKPEDEPEDEPPEDEPEDEETIEDEDLGRPSCVEGCPAADLPAWAEDILTWAGVSLEFKNPDTWITIDLAPLIMPTTDNGKVPGTLMQIREAYIKLESIVDPVDPDRDDESSGGSIGPTPGHGVIDPAQIWHDIILSEGAQSSSGPTEPWVCPWEYRDAPPCGWIYCPYSKNPQTGRPIKQLVELSCSASSSNDSGIPDRKR